MLRVTPFFRDTGDHYCIFLIRVPTLRLGDIIVRVISVLESRKTYGQAITSSSGLPAFKREILIVR